MRFSTEYGYYTINQLPGQPNVAVCTDFTIYPEFRGKHLAQFVKQDQNEQLKRLGYVLAICTTQSKNGAQTKVLKKAGWRILASFFDIRTLDTVFMWQYDVPAHSSASVT